MSSPWKDYQPGTWIKQKELADMANMVRLSGKFQQFRADGHTPSYQYMTAEQSQYNSARLTFTVAATSGEGTEAKVAYIRCLANGAVAEALAAKAGQAVDFTGRIEIKKKVTAGGTQYYTNIIAEKINDDQEVA